MCVRGVVTSVPGCVLPSTPCEEGAPRVKEAVCVSETVCVNEAPCVSGTTCAPETARVCEQPCGSEARCVKETARVSERPSVRETACVRSLCVREMMVGMREHAAASPGVRVMEWSVSFVTQRCAWIEC